jgi:hypothetical protein
MSNYTPRSAAQIRVAFKSLLVQRLPRRVTLEKVHHLLDEARAAALPADSQTVGDYLRLLGEMERWCKNEGDLHR